jgi:hypothetical protein
MIPEYDHYLVREIRILEDINHELEFENNKLRDVLYECQGLLEDCQAERKQIEELLCTVE